MSRSTQSRGILREVQPINNSNTNVQNSGPVKARSKAKSGKNGGSKCAKHAQAGAFELSNEEWKSKLTAEEYAVLREGRTEDANTGKYVAHVGNGMYMCAGCGVDLYESTHKFEYACGWPAFHSNRVNAVKRVDVSKGNGPKKVEIRCTGCDGHLGHVFQSKRYPGPNNERHCVNSVALRFAPLSE